MLPYLHERKVYLNRLKNNTKYFYTTKQEEIIVSQDFEKQENQEIVKEVKSTIFAFNISESKMYVYSEEGLLLNRMEFKNLVTEYGDIMSASSDGLNFLLYNKPKDSVTIVRFNENDFRILKTFKIKKVIDDFLQRIR